MTDPLDATWARWNHIHSSLFPWLRAAIMAPLVISVHNIVGLDFAGIATFGWHSTEFPPFFVFGALLSGFATVLLLVVPLRRLLSLESFITGRHLDVLCKMLLAVGLCLAEANMMVAFSVFYCAESAGMAQFVDTIKGSLAWIFGQQSCSTSQSIFPYSMHAFDAGDGDRRLAKSLEPEHRAQTPLDCSMIQFDQIVT